MLEIQQGLATWSLAQGPDAAPSIPARGLPDHRLAYLEYEGPISDGRGSVTRWDRGNYQLQQHDRDELVALVAGEKLVGQVTLKRSADSADEWAFSFTPFA
jgi:hypothetical protein